ncbi:cell wall biosynthesis glycosyltransferase [candidate division LCP-89 bacterium B3_LCP]|uniref:Cell wall biosynthesis glycosyltransferase n=1 Tax=candidate division LCP-89 bacterium B3_LCP TaxID=2012998 RepID=A0A532V5R8_UNCL8|nr:MAG: cell wall biosynthesis glycosyltransferase [candidate division LCP-89 bacterium B3_LCP]
MSSKSLTIFFPCFNEEGNVQKAVEAAIEAAQLITDDYEVIVVNDGSVDQTGPIADKIAAENDRVRVVHHGNNRGYGIALQSGYRNASKDAVFYTDGDLQFDIKEITKLWPLLDDYDVVTGYRIKRMDPFIRKLNSYGWTSLTKMLFGLPVRDVNCAFKLFRREVIADMELKSEGALIDAEVFARAKKADYRITEIGVHHYPRQTGSQTGANPLVIFVAFWELFKLWWKLR